MLRRHLASRAILPGAAALGLVACEADPSSDVADVRAAPAENWERDVESTALDVDLATKRATATVRFASSPRRGGSLEVGDLAIDRVRDASGREVRFAVRGGRLDLAIAAKKPVEVTIDYTFGTHVKLEGWTKQGVTFLWPHFCGNLFPCKSDPADGVRFTLDVHDATLAPGESLVFASEIPADAPAYMLAWARGAYTHQALGTTRAGTRVGLYHLPGEAKSAAKGVEPLVDAFDWLEATYGAYTFGGEVASVSAPWGEGAFGGMEHHPYWHVASDAMNDPETHVHEAAHGWFGDGVRIACWEDLVLSEGTTSYVTARAIEAVRGTSAGDAVWADYEARLDTVIASEDRIAWPAVVDGERRCNAIDVLGELWNDVPYMKGAFFLRAVEREVGREAIDGALRAFYAEHVGEAASMSDLFATIEAETGFDPGPLADAWLARMGRPDAP
jgi:aminopeptidase N